MGGKSVRPESFSPALRNFFIFCVLAEWTRTDGKTRNTGFLGPFGLGHPLGTLRKMQFTGARGTVGKKNPSAPKFYPRSCATFYILRFGPSEPQGQEIAKYWVYRPFWPRAAPWPLEFRAGNRKTHFTGARGTFRKKIRRAQKFLTEVAQLCYLLRFRRPNPQGGKSQNTGFLGPFGVGQPPGT